VAGDDTVLATIPAEMLLDVTAPLFLLILRIFFTAGFAARVRDIELFENLTLFQLVAALMTSLLKLFLRKTENIVDPGTIYLKMKFCNDSIYRFSSESHGVDGRNLLLGPRMIFLGFDLLGIYIPYWSGCCHFLTPL
jgi:hypothetical protein